MSLPLQNTEIFPPIHESDVSIIRREFVILTGNHFSAVILNQLLYWTLRVKDFDLLLEEEGKFYPDCNVSPRHGWIYKTAHELNEETMLGLSPPSVRKYLKQLVDCGWIDERRHPLKKWDKTTQYRVNLRKVQQDLSSRGRSLPDFYLKVLPSYLRERSHCPEEISNERNFVSNEKNFDSKENLDGNSVENSLLTKESLNQRNFDSNGKIFDSSEKNFASNERNFCAIPETTHKNINKDHTQRTRVREKNSDFENSESLVSKNSLPEESVSEAMIRLWEYHVVQKLSPRNWKGVLHLTVTRKDQLESLFSFHFKNDMGLWERFCLQVKAAPFLMGGGPNGWKVSLDWILFESNLLKILEGNYGRLGKDESEDLPEEEANLLRQAEKAAILDSIKDPTWRNWCCQLAIGVRLNEQKMLQSPLSLAELQEIADAYFIECEGKKLVWIGSHDPKVLKKIEDLRLKINWVFAKEYPKARTFRTRLELTNPLKQDADQFESEESITTKKGEIHA